MFNVGSGAQGIRLRKLRRGGLKEDGDRQDACPTEFGGTKWAEQSIHKARLSLNSAG